MNKNNFKINPAAKRALEEAEKRRIKKNETQNMPKEIGGREKPEATRYGDWEKKGIISDF